MFRPSCFFIIIVVLFVLDVTGSLIILSINFLLKFLVLLFLCIRMLSQVFYHIFYHIKLKVYNLVFPPLWRKTACRCEWKIKGIFCVIFLYGNFCWRIETLLIDWLIDWLNEWTLCRLLLIGRRRVLCLMTFNLINWYCLNFCKS